MHIILGILASQGLVWLLRAFGDMPVHAECAVAFLSSGLFTFLAMQWKER